MLEMNGGQQDIDGATLIALADRLHDDIRRAEQDFFFLLATAVDERERRITAELPGMLPGFRRIAESRAS